MIGQFAPSPSSIAPDPIDWLIGVWLFVLGGVIGSFLNVVIYRLPLGMSLVQPGSHCPACKRPIRWFHNVPILGWLTLGGRCRDCGARISAKYPIVEALTASAFTLLGAAECLGEGANLPVPVEGRLLPYGICAYHLLLLCTLLAAAMIEGDGHRVPPRLALPALMVGGIAPLVWPRLHPVPALPAWWVSPEGWSAGLLDGATGLTAGVILGWLAAPCCAPAQRPGMVLGAACAGLFLGWQAAVALTLATLAIHLPLRAVGCVLPGVRRIPATAWLALETLGWILCWSWLLGEPH